MHGYLYRASLKNIKAIKEIQNGHNLNNSVPDENHVINCSLEGKWSIKDAIVDRGGAKKTFLGVQSLDKLILERR